MLYTVFLHKSHIWEKSGSVRYGPKDSHPARLHHFYISRITRTKWWNSLIFCMLTPIHENLKFTKIFLGGQTWTWSLLQQDSKIGSISRMNWRNKLFCMLMRKVKINYFWVAAVKNGLGFLVHGALQYAVSEDWI